MDIKELKAQVYDHMVAVEQHQAAIRQLNQMITESVRAQQAHSIEPATIGD